MIIKFKNNSVFLRQDFYRIGSCTRKTWRERELQANLLTPLKYMELNVRLKGKEGIYFDRTDDG
jgi:hypothetical protein